MVGLRTQEGSEFLRFFGLVQAEAEKRKSVFFLECGEGNEFSGDGIEGEDLRGWLIPAEDADEFEKVWLNGDPGDEWEDNIVWAVWNGDENNPSVSIKKF